MNDLGFVHRFVPANGNTGRVLLLLHGTGGDESDLLPIGRELDPEAALLTPRGNVSENGHPRFFRRFAEGVFDEEDVVRRANELADFLLAAAAKYEFDAKTVTAIGYSNGANIAAAMLLLRPAALEAAVLFRAMVPLSKPAAAKLEGKRVFISAGSQDPIIPRENVENLAGFLRASGAEVQVVVQDAGHGLPEDLAAAERWLGA